ncbi:hypothetical protein C5Y96_10525 [Blastopirellula marina]|uniref:DUF1549 domain-containing protein n=1 Tax=Blastopirellula marina TaxID=124 RepID=A0A2S8FM61_9BACT|nr:MULTISPECIES: DUF1549 domain-containing protein [Pirellulaceae]PQO33279.1 hypothetical protein C5Y96_10525 [Blastopirellula marina]RCS52368.1 DUF1549 domain-containing protein [Bremerella cremea]
MKCVSLISLLVLMSPGGSVLADQPDSVVPIVNARLAGLLESNVNQSTDRSAFLRRVSLDLIGRIPTSAEAREFAASSSEQSRDEVIRRLGDSPAASKRLATFVRTLWFPQTSVSPYEYLATDTEAWIADQLNQGRPLNEIAREMISVSYAPEKSEAREVSPNRLTTPKTLIEANDHRPERMAANATGAFLGVDLSCAQCHDHPFDSYSQQQFWQTAAFFVAKSRFEDDRKWYELEIEIPDAGKSVPPALFVEDSPSQNNPRDGQLTSGREFFARWVSQADNPFFARWTVNQLWAEYFGQPLVTTQPDQVAHPVRQQALDILADGFVEHHFDLRWLAKAIVSTDAYQMQYNGATVGASDPYPYRITRGLTGPQLYESLNIAAGKPPIHSDLDSAEQLHDRQAFYQLFPAYRSVDVERSATQALSLMNGEKIAQLSDPSSNPLVQGLATAPFLSEKDCIESMYWSTLSRPPSQREWDTLRTAGFLEDDLARRDKRLGDLFWVLVNSVEFSTNH